MRRHVWTRRQLKRFEEISELWDRMHQMGIPNKRIYEQYIEPKYGIGISTFYRVLNVPVPKLMKEMGDANVLVTDERFNRMVTSDE